MNILIFDNYDSFTYNLVHAVEKVTHQKPDVARNDQIPMEKINEYDKIIISPGPGLPEESGILLSMIKEYAATKSILGVCLGQQAIAQSFGGKLKNLATVFHGVATPVHLKDYAPKKENDIFRDFPETFDAGRYHSWIVDAEDFPTELEVTAIDDQGQIMGLQHKTYDIQGVQFHPESVLTPLGDQLIKNWLKP